MIFKEGKYYLICIKSCFIFLFNKKNSKQAFSNPDKIYLVSLKFSINYQFKFHTIN